MEVIYGSAYGSGQGPLLVACQAEFYSFYSPEFVPVENCSSSTASNLTCSHQNEVGLRCSPGQCEFCLHNSILLHSQYWMNFACFPIIMHAHTCTVDVVAIPRGSRRLGSSSYYLQCFAQQFPWNTSPISGGWYDSDGKPVTETSNGGPVRVDTLLNEFDTGGLGINLTYTFRNQLNFNHPLRVSDGGYYQCNVSVEITYPDKSTVKLSNVTVHPLIIEGERNTEHDCIAISGQTL